MTCRIMLPYGGGEAESGAVQLAARVARLLDGTVDALFVSKTLLPMSGQEQEGFDHIQATEGLATANQFLEAFYNSQHKDRVAAARKRYDCILEKIGAGGQFSWHEQVDVFQELEPLLQKSGFLHDLTICSFALSSPLLDMVVEDVLLATGRPVVFSTANSAASSDFTTVIAWKAVPPTVRAMTAALPLLRAASRCIVASVEEGDLPRGPTVNDMVDYLATTGIKAEAQTVTAEGKSAQAALEAFCTHVSADILVMGAYSQSRLKQYVFGGFTRHFLKNQSCSVLMTA